LCLKQLPQHFYLVGSTSVKDRVKVVFYMKWIERGLSGRSGSSYYRLRGYRYII